MALDRENPRKGYQNGVQLPKGHQDRFLAKLEAELPEQKRTFTNFYWKVAAAVVLLVGSAMMVVVQQSTVLPVSNETVTHEESSSSKSDSPTIHESIASQITLGDLSPDLKKFEEYYIANINVELASLEVNKANKALLEGYMQQLNELNTEYKSLTKELNVLGPNQQTVDALITNLQLRLQLLYRLKDRLEALKKSNQNEGAARS